MACDKWDLSSWFTPDSSQPDFTSNYTLGSSVELAWWGGTPYILDQRQNWRLILAWFNDTDAASALSSGRSEAITSAEGWIFTYGYGGNPSWVMPNVCGHTALGMQWLVDPLKIDISSNRKFKIFGLNMTDGQDISTVTSPGFLLLPSSILSSLSSESTAMPSISSSTTQSSPTPSTAHAAGTSSSGTSQSSPPPSATNTVAASRNPIAPTSNARGRSKGAKAGIGVGCTLLACLILLGVFLLMRRRRRRPQKIQKLETSASEKPELDGRVAKRSVPEVSGNERYELNEQYRIGEMEGSGIGEMEGRLFTAVEIPSHDYGSY